MILSSDVAYTMPAASLPLQMDTTLVPFSIVTEPIETHSSLLLPVTQNTSHKDSQVHDTACFARVIRWFGPLGRLWMLVYHAILGGVGVVAFRVQFSEEWC